MKLLVISVVGFILSFYDLFCIENDVGMASFTFWHIFAHSYAHTFIMKGILVT